MVMLPPPTLKKHALDIEQSHERPCQHLDNIFKDSPTDKKVIAFTKCWVQNGWCKVVVDITWFDGKLPATLKKPPTTPGLACTTPEWASTVKHLYCEPPLLQGELSHSSMSQYIPGWASTILE